MFRAVTADHVMFNECIHAFRPKELIFEPQQNKQNDLVGYLLLDFELTQEFQFNYFKIQPTYQVQLPGAYSAFIAPVILPQWLDEHHNAHFFTIALSAIFSFVTARPTKSTRDGYIIRRTLNEQTLNELAIQFPVLTAGPGCHDIRLSQESTTKIFKDLEETIDYLFKLPYESYTQMMQSIRLVHLAHLNKRDDFALAYYLLISSIEPIARGAIKRKTIAINNEKETKWVELAKSNVDFEEILNAFQSTNKYIGQRFVEFILKYCPLHEWNDLEHPQENSTTYIAELTGQPKQEWLTQKNWFEVYPEDLTEQQIRTILADTYNYRSLFTHEGKYPPHRNPISYNKFFDVETFYDYNEKTGDLKVKELILPNFRLITFIATRSLINFMRMKITH